jgi:hypothetical protein
MVFSYGSCTGKGDELVVAAGTLLRSRNSSRKLNATPLRNGAVAVRYRRAR